MKQKKDNNAQHESFIAPSKGKSRKWLIIIISALILVIVAMVGFYLIHNNPDSVKSKDATVSSDTVNTEVEKHNVLNHKQDEKIPSVAISARVNRTVGLKKDGTAVAVGFNDFGQCDVSDWTDMMVD